MYRTSHLLYRTSYIASRTSYLASCISHFASHTSHLVPRPSSFVPRTSSLVLFFAYCLLPTAYSQDQWHIPAKDINPSNYYGVTVANGMIGIISSPNPLEVKDVVLNGAFDTYGRGRVSNIMKVFSFANMYLEVDGKRLARKDIANYAQTLDMKGAALSTTFDYSNILSVKQEIMALRHLPHTALITCEITAKKDCDIIPASIIETPDNLKEGKNFYSEIDRPHIVIPLMTSVAKSPTGKLTLAVSNTFLFEEAHGSEPHVIHEEWDNNMHLLKFKKHLKAGETYQFSVVGSVISTAQSADPQNEAERMTIVAALEKKERLLQRHHEAWDQLWSSDIQIEGDPQAQRDIHSALYHLYSFIREGSPYSLSPMGLSGLGYNGHVFWDTELWMYPVLVVLHPELAKSALEYRFNGLEKAKSNASSYGFKGAKFPWEGDDSGQESCPVWALSGPFEHHITGDVGFAQWKYYQITHDKEWLRTRGYPVLKAVADFWASRAELGKDQKYHILNVVCADEWAENVDDNAFTNGVAKEVLGYASQAATELGFTPDPNWKKVADQIAFLHFPDGVTKEFATYKGEPIKQTDVNLLSYPLKVVNDDATIKKDLDFYENVLGDKVLGPGHSPAMAHAIFSILHSRRGEPEAAYKLFIESYKPNEVPPFGVLAETAGGTNPYFATGAGGFLQTVLNGFGGLDITDAGIIQLKTKLPKQWKSITITGVGTEKKTFTVK